MIYDDGSFYRGSWHNDQFHGHGVWKHSNGDIYEGNLEKGQANNFGKYTYANGSSYQGLWKNDSYHGYGTEI